MRADVCRTWDEWDDLRECQCVVTEEQETATILLGVSDCVCVVPEQEPGGVGCRRAAAG